MHPCDEKAVGLGLTVSRHFQEFHFRGFTVVVTFTRKGTKCPLVLCQNPAASRGSFMTTAESQTLKTEYYLPIKSVYSAYHSACPFLRAPQGRLSRLTIVGRGVKAHAGVPSSPPRPSQRKMTEAFWTRSGPNNPS